MLGDLFHAEVEQGQFVGPATEGPELGCCYNLDNPQYTKPHLNIAGDVEDGYL